LSSKLLYNNRLIEAYQQSILNWYNSNKRELPWRANSNFYNVWISEIILQQTRVNQGLNYYLRFIKRFPNVGVLAAADEDEVLKLWEGLGYYSRARNLHYGAKQIVDLGEFPDSYDNWLKIKGVGAYTAAAISSIVLNEARAVVDGNVQRVLSRLLNYSGAVNSHTGMKEVTAFANTLLYTKVAGDYNQAVMELGARVCKPKNPNCVDCCVSKFCEAFKKNTVENLPVKEKKVKVENRFLHFYLLKKGTKILVQRRGTGNIWAGLYQFPMLETPSLTSTPNPVKNGILKGADMQNLTLLKEVKHQLTHRKLHLFFWEAVINTSATAKTENAEWYEINDLEKLAFPRPLRELIGEYLLNLE